MPLKIPEYVQILKPYKPGNLRLKSDLKRPHINIINLASNENPLGTSSKAISAIMESAFQVANYPDPVCSELIQKISMMYNKDPEQIICGHGSESLIAHIINAFADVGTEVLTAAGTFVGIYVKTNKIGRKLQTVPLDKDYCYDLDALQDKINSNTRIIYISNPNNPTGTMITKEKFESFIKKIPEDILVVLDEAYYTYASMHKDYPDGLDYDYPNLIVLRTLSKTHGLAGLRIGYAIGPESLITTLYKVKLPFEPGIVAQKAAFAAIDDEDFVNDTLKVNSRALEILKKTFDKLDVYYPEPRANFLMVKMPDVEFARKFTDFTREYGIIVRHLEPFGLPECVRISTGNIKETEYAAGVFEEAYLQLIANNNLTKISGEK